MAFRWLPAQAALPQFPEDTPKWRPFDDPGEHKFAITRRILEKLERAKGIEPSTFTLAT